MQTEVSKCEDGVSVRIPTAFAKKLDIEEGTPVQIMFREENEEIVIRPMKKKYSLEELVNEIEQNGDIPIKA